MNHGLLLPFGTALKSQTLCTLERTAEEPATFDKLRLHYKYLDSG